MALLAHLPRSYVSITYDSKVFCRQESDTSLLKMFSENVISSCDLNITNEISKYFLTSINNQFDTIWMIEWSYT